MKLNRYIDRYMVCFVLSVFMISPVHAQVKLIGEDKATPGDLNKVQIKIEKGQDLKIIVLKDGVPTLNEWLAMKELDNSPVILLQPNLKTKKATYTIIAAVNQDNKTFTDTKTIKVEPAEPEPEPEPTSQLTKEIVNLYGVNKDPVTKDQLILGFEEVRKEIPSLKSYGDLETTIAAHIQKRVPSQSPLRTVRDRLGAHLLDKTGIDPRRWDQKVALDTTDEILIALRACR